MPRTMLGEEMRRAERDRRADEELLGRIGAYLSVTGRNVGQLAERCGMSKSTMYNRMEKPGEFRLSEYRRVMEELAQVRS